MTVKAHYHRWPINGKFQDAVHVYSDRPGPEGEAELRRWARKAGVPTAWVDRKHPEFPHFDLWRSWFTRAQGLPEASNKDMVVDWTVLKVAWKEAQSAEA